MTDLKSIPLVSAVDFADVDMICGYQVKICQIFGSEGGFNIPTPDSPAIRQVRAQGRQWLAEVKRTVSDILACRSGAPTLAAIPRLIDSFDVFHRICNAAPDNDYIAAVLTQTAALWVRGNKTITETDLVIQLLKLLNRSPQSLPDKYADFAVNTLGDWIDQLTRRGRFHGITQAEAYTRLAFIITDNLSAFLPARQQSAAKLRWINNHLLTDGAIAALDPRTRQAYLSFARTQPA